MRIKSMIAMLAVLGLIAFTRSAGTAQSPRETSPQGANPDSAVLTSTDKEELSLVLRLRAALGDQIWPGFGNASIPIILYNSHHEFLFGTTNPPAPWAIVDGDDFQGHPYYRRVAAEPQAFAVPVGAEWAGSLTTLDWMNVRSPLKLGRDSHSVALLHEMFHAFQAKQSPAHFKNAQAVYKVEARYPFNDSDFAAAWNNEGSLLATALKAKEDAEARRAAHEFLQARAARRARASLSPELIDYERELEWLEGLAHYVEIRSYELASAHASEAPFKDFKPSLPIHLSMSFFRLEKQLGSQKGDLRFYVSGMAQARLLDRLSAGWQARALGDRSYLEDLLQEVATQNTK
jgi:hypothetical protein